MPDYPKVPQQISDPISENLAKLSELFPAAVKDGGLDMEALRAELGDFEEIKPGDETYELNWVGKQAAKKEAFKPLLGKTLALKDDGINSETTQNIYIEGDNLEALKLLRQNYYGEVKMIYIDPPYNTGKDFVYRDNFTAKREESDQEEGTVNEEGKRLVKNEKTSNRFHARWLDMMYPRLRAAKDLLRDDGVILISIDDAEIDNLKRLCKEVFGETNELATLVWDKNRKNDARYFSVGHEYMVVYAKNPELLRIQDVVFREPKYGIEKALEIYLSLKEEHGDNYDQIQQEWRKYFNVIPESDEFKKIGRFSKVGPKGPYRDDGDISWPGGKGPHYEVTHPVTGKPCKQPKGGWVYPTKAGFDAAVKSGRVVFGEDHTTMPRQARYLFDGEGQVMRSVNFSYAQTATMEFVEIFGSRVFENPKNWRDINRLCQYLTNKDDIILDFFSGSATTAHAVMQLNAEDGGVRKFILAQLSESCGEDSEASKAGFKSIPEIGKERIRRTGKIINQELRSKQADWEERKALDSKKGGKLKLDDAAVEETNPYIIAPDALDIGFKSFRIEDTKINWLKKDLRGEDIIAEAGLTTQDALDFVPGYTDTDVVYELMLRQSNIPLTGTITKPITTAKRTYLFADAYLICLEEKITQKLVESLAAIEPTPNKYFFRDSAFGTDIALKDETFRRLKAEIHKHHGDLGTAYTVEFI
ncbi:MAG: site-specific DNA-methyltransferase [Verrucomicrobia bacterium]|nr:MAG: site-specific DNA-methyltransferase [Verrucomicrobiota bacterium]